MWQGTPDTWTNLHDWTRECTFTSLKVCSLKVRMSETWYPVTKDSACSGMCTFLEWSSCLGQRSRIEKVRYLSLILKNPEGRPGRGNGARKDSKAKCSFLGTVCLLYDQSIRSGRDQDPGERPSMPHWSRRSSPEGLKNRSTFLERFLQPQRSGWIWTGLESRTPVGVCRLVYGLTLCHSKHCILYSLVQPLKQS